MDSFLPLFLTHLVVPLVIACIAIKASHFLLDSLEQ